MYIAFIYTNFNLRESLHRIKATIFFIEYTNSMHNDGLLHLPYSGVNKLPAAAHNNVIQWI